MALSAPWGVVLAEGITGDQVKQLSAVMLGLVVFAAVFVLVERQRSSDHTEPAPPPEVEEPAAAPQPIYASDSGRDQGQAAGSDVPLTQGSSETLPEELPVPFVPRSREPAPPPPRQPPAGAKVPERAIEPPPPGQASAPRQENPAADRPADRRSGPPGPESPGDIGIVIPDDGEV